MNKYDYLKFLYKNNLNNVFFKGYQTLEKYGLEHAVGLVGQNVPIIPPVPPEPEPETALDVIQRNYKLTSLEGELTAYCLLNETQLDKPSVLNQQTDDMDIGNWDYLFLKFNFWYVKDLAASIPAIKNIMPAEMMIFDRRAIGQWGQIDNGAQQTLQYQGKDGSTDFALYGNGGPANFDFHTFYSCPLLTYCNSIHPDPAEDQIHFLWGNEKVPNFQTTIMGQTYKRDFYIFGDKPNKKMYWASKIYGESFKTGATITVDLNWGNLSFGVGYTATQTGSNPQPDQGIFHYQYAAHLKFLPTDHPTDVENWLSTITV